MQSIDIQAPDIWQGKRYNSYTRQLKETYGGRVQKTSIHADFTCPNRDGSKGRGGCTFCNNDSFTPSYLPKQSSITQQIDEGLVFLEKRYKNPEKYVGYFQAYSNTYGTLDRLKEVYSEALAHPKLDGLVIGTRPDCINEEQLDYLQELAEKHIIVLEFGIESCYNDTLERINRGHTFEDSVKAIEMAQGRGFHIGGHILFGLPGDSKEKMLDQAEILSELPLESLKFHQLQIVKRTIMAKQYKDNPDYFNLFTPEGYVDFMVDFLERLNPEIAIQRFSSEAPPNLRVAPNWGLRIYEVQQMIEKRLEERGTWQGKRFAQLKMEN